MLGVLRNNGRAALVIKVARIECDWRWNCVPHCDPFTPPCLSALDISVRRCRKFSFPFFPVQDAVSAAIRGCLVARELKRTPWECDT